MQSKNIFISILVQLVYILPSILPAEYFNFSIYQCSMTTRRNRINDSACTNKMQIAITLFCILILLRALKLGAFYELFCLIEVFTVALFLKK